MAPVCQSLRSRPRLLVVPKGLAVSTDSLKPRLQVLKEFEGGKPWRECQQEYVQRLNDEKISDAAAGADGGAPLARMLKQVFVMLGLAWVDPDDRVESRPPATSS